MSFDNYQVDVGHYVQTYPTILGFNAAGTIAEVGPGVTDLNIGDEVRQEKIQLFNMPTTRCPR
jgi:Zn-dependent alcohol dehydrogenase